ncbi:hypothetical protein [Xanthomonas floridensis]|uniref:Phosphoesterase n=1 Tax=Xanthomonas floridensis TaxID=1843580 RepID=A0A1A9M802_9XANT|nr:hypothetical protein [Xanthomonas floridensis]MEA5122730.1 hypothetical protein [Xanthomonas floridensis]MEA5131230.1 hypothetical protein [Xanthomonas floridensis]OAG66252.1 hypothetical protein A7D17_04815 [Xanthomonas floridensis]
MRALGKPMAALAIAIACAAGAHAAQPPGSDDQPHWLAGDHHVHSEWSVTWDRSTAPPTPIRGGDSPYTRERNAQQALANGLSWIVHTDHGGPGHSVVTREQAWPALQRARRTVPQLIQFHGMEFDVPAAEHASLIIAPGPHEQAQLQGLERDYNRAELLDGSTRDTEQAMLDAVRAMQALRPQPVLIVNHPSRTATAPGRRGKVSPAELRAWQDAAPQVVIGMEGAPGHQADTQHRGLYRNAAAPTLGGFDQMTAQVGGVWDGMLAEGRHFWITATSDSHRNWRDGGAEFDPGEYSKTYVLARRDPADILRALRAGKSFAVTGDLIDAMDLQLQSTAADGRIAGSAGLGETLRMATAASAQIALRLHEPSQANRHGQRPQLQHVDVIVGTTGHDGALQMQVQRIERNALRQRDGWLVASMALPDLSRGGFVRVRGSSTDQQAPLPDTAGEDPWQDLWFYSNPVFVAPAR